MYVHTQYRTRMYVHARSVHLDELAYAYTLEISGSMNDELKEKSGESERTREREKEREGEAVT